MKVKISAVVIKYFAVILMTIDHCALVFVEVDSIWYHVMRFFGRTVAPVMCFFIVEGFRHTKSRKKYLLRMLIFAVISQPAYALMTNNFLRLNVMYTFAVSLVMLIISCENRRLNVYLKTLLIAVFFCLSMLGDWKHFIPVWMLIFWLFKDNFKKQIVMFLIATFAMITLNNFNGNLYRYGSLFSVVPLIIYSGERGGGNNKVLKAFNKWFFYFYYPAHMMVLVLLKSYH